MLTARAEPVSRHRRDGPIGALAIVPWAGGAGRCRRTALGILVAADLAQTQKRIARRMTRIHPSEDPS